MDWQLTQEGRPFDEGVTGRSGSRVKHLAVVHLATGTYSDMQQSLDKEEIALVPCSAQDSASMADMLEVDREERR